MAGDDARVQERKAPLTVDRPRRWPWVVAGATLALYLVANLLYPREDAELTFVAMFGSIIAAFVLVGALLAVRVPGNPIGPIILGSGALLASTVAIGTLGILGAARGGVPVELLAIAALCNDLGFTVPIIVVLVGIPLIFPDGRLLSARWRWVVVLAVSAMVALGLSLLLGPDPIGDPPMDNPFTIPQLEPLMRLLGGYASWSAVVGFGAALLAVVIRYRRGDEVERHQLKWLIAVAIVAAVAFPVAFIVPPGPVADAAFVVGMLSLLALPLAIGVAVLRYRLYDIDRVISRTLGWALISGLLLGAFAVLVVGLQALLSSFTQGQTLAVAGSTLAAFALFQPVRRRVQGAVDRRFDRARYDAQLTADRFAERLRDEVDLDALARELEGAVYGAIRPTSATLWLPRRNVVR
jgi:hypothetical protein